MIQFDSATHTYTFNGKALESVSNIVKRLTPEFDRFKVSMQMSSKRGVSQEDILAEWDRSRDISLAKGEAVHAYIEDYLGDQSLFAHKPSMPECNAFLDAWAFMRDEYDIKPVEWEKIVWSEKLGIAGRIDILASTNKGLCTIDWKTGKYRTSNRFQKMLKPFADLDDCEHSKASIQTSLYEAMLNEMGVELVNRFIVNLMPDGSYSIINGKCLKSRVIECLS